MWKVDSADELRQGCGRGVGTDARGLTLRAAAGGSFVVSRAGIAILRQGLTVGGALQRRNARVRPLVLQNRLPAAEKK